MQISTSRILAALCCCCFLLPLGSSATTSNPGLFQAVQDTDRHNRDGGGGGGAAGPWTVEQASPPASRPNNTQLHVTVPLDFNIGFGIDEAAISGAFPSDPEVGPPSGVPDNSIGRFINRTGVGGAQDNQFHFGLHDRIETQFRTFNGTQNHSWVEWNMDQYPADNVSTVTPGAGFDPNDGAYLLAAGGGGGFAVNAFGDRGVNQLIIRQDHGTLIGSESVSYWECTADLKAAGGSEPGGGFGDFQGSKIPNSQQLVEPQSMVFASNAGALGRLISYDYVNNIVVWHRSSVPLPADGATAFTIAGTPGTLPTAFTVAGNCVEFSATLGPTVVSVAGENSMRGYIQVWDTANHENNWTWRAQETGPPVLKLTAGNGVGINWAGNIPAGGLHVAGPTGEGSSGTGAMQLSYRPGTSAFDSIESSNTYGFQMFQDFSATNSQFENLTAMRFNTPGYGAGTTPKNVKVLYIDNQNTKSTFSSVIEVESQTCTTAGSNKCGAAGNMVFNGGDGITGHLAFDASNDYGDHFFADQTNNTFERTTNKAPDTNGDGFPFVTATGMSELGPAMWSVSTGLAASPITVTNGNEVCGSKGYTGLCNQFVGLPDDDVGEPCASNATCRANGGGAEGTGRCDFLNHPGSNGFRPGVGMTCVDVVTLGTAGAPALGSALCTANHAVGVKFIAFCK